MVHQISIHGKIDHANYAWLKQYQLRTGIPMNRLINIAIQRFVEVAQSWQRAKMAGRQIEWVDDASNIGIQSTYGMD